MALHSKFLRSLLAALHLVGIIACVLPLPAQASPEEDMDKLMAPIALYPDALLAQTLTAATSPEQVTEFHKWLGEQTATGSDLQQAAQDAKFDAAFASLAVFPDVIKLLAENMDWTKAIGASYQSDKKAVEASIQRLRAQAKQQGNLETNEQQSVKVETEGSTQVIIIEPANPQVVYVPVYDPAKRDREVMTAAMIERWWLVMKGGFAMLAWPAEYGQSGVMTFMVGPDGVLLQKDIGEATATAPEAITAFDPDSTWSTP